MTYIKFINVKNRSRTRQLIMNQGFHANGIRLHPDRCNCRNCRRRFNLPKHHSKD